MYIKLYNDKAWVVKSIFLRNLSMLNNLGEREREYKELVYARE